jgi:methylglutaconyl-CoA hydratase
VFETIEQVDAYIQHLTQILVNSSPAAMRQLKQVFWQGTGHWDQLLDERAAMSGQLVLSDFTKNAIAAFMGKG